MGQNASSEQKHGYHVLKVVPGSPAARAGLIPFFDYIVAVNKTLLDEEANSLIKVISDNINSRLSFYVYSSKTNAYRNVKFEFPIEKWTTTGENGWLGFSVRYCSYDGAADHFWHVLAVVKDFPAFLAGIQPKTDYIIGSPNHILHNQTDLYDLFDKYINKPLHLYVYSTVTNKCREIIVVPTSKNGEGW
ncbi:hypothetical protein LY90DRAFT_55848 [Neocallimastix californiae]|uniref:PDZ GRASP-type domain-containing protein n=1 Tax=Neocallimastix californiae TaxID=1754190 RepID=A0A1Y2BQX2_9FUNG|nr:hypothetical protein LY90DRAFT_55848 [Neocallimastix californiae]|eukprot:ORY37140.1 hypothetical protein LY90DRAFT_55848 [Neocallimastix californiae]